MSEHRADAVRVSLLIATRNRRESLRRTLEAIRAVRCAAPWELIVVDNGSTDGTLELVEEFAESADVPVVGLREARPGRSHALNTGIRAARGDLLTFTDDDCYPEPDFLDQVIARFDADSGLGVLGGRLLLYDPDDAPVTIAEETTPISIEPHSYVASGVIHGANMSLRRAVLEQVGGFDPVFGTGTAFPAEDVELVARVIHAGWRGEFHPGPAVHHHHGRKPGPDIERLYRGYNYARGAYFTKYILRRPTRTTYLKRWYWRVRAGRRQVWGVELLGGLHYLGVRIRRALTGRTGAGTPPQ